MGSQESGEVWHRYQAEPTQSHPQAKSRSYSGSKGEGNDYECLMGCQSAPLNLLRTGLSAIEIYSAPACLSTGRSFL